MEHSEKVSKQKPEDLQDNSQREAATAVGRQAVPNFQCTIVRSDMYNQRRTRKDSVAELRSWIWES